VNASQFEHERPLEGMEVDPQVPRALGSHNVLRYEEDGEDVGEPVGAPIEEDGEDVAIAVGADVAIAVGADVAIAVGADVAIAVGEDVGGDVAGSQLVQPPHTAKAQVYELHHDAQ